MLPCKALFVGLAVALAACPQPVLAQAGQPFVEPCARTESFTRPATGGPYDYRNQRSALRMVEDNHYIPQIENLIKGKTGTLASEHSFVLHAFPNHHRALASLARYSEKLKSRQPGDLDYPVDCYFERALRFRSDDLIVRMLYADYLGRTQRANEAAAQLEFVKASAPDNPMTQYNVGLLYFQLGRFADALAQAHRAAELGMPRTELMDKLKAKGQWADATKPPVLAAPAAASAASR